MTEIDGKLYGRGSTDDKVEEGKDTDTGVDTGADTGINKGGGTEGGQKKGGLKGNLKDSENIKHINFLLKIV